ncbi:hypothetical protein [Bacillus marasmi]|uniref:hypothetical protein n=1 Tax=Bacillus marasmi TaxID=1926279 RepID=UPI0011CB8A59|nr:hypothetical protein [Bacillus marasmi]
MPNRFSKQRWEETLQQQWPSNNENDMSRIPANALFLRKKKQELTIEKDDRNQTIVWREGIVTRVRHEQKGNIALIETSGIIFEVELTVWDIIPKQMEFVEIGIPIAKIIWYPSAAIR